MRGVRFVKLLEKSRLPCIHIIYQHQWIPYSLPVGGFPCRWASSPWAGVAAAGAERVKLCLLFQVGAKSHCKMFFPPLALRVVLKLNWFWLANKNRTAKLNFLRNVVNPVWKINPKMCFPSCTLCLVFILLGLPSPSLCSLHRHVSGWQGWCPYAEVLWWAAVGANGSWDILAWPVHFFQFPIHVLSCILSSCSFVLAVPPAHALPEGRSCSISVGWMLCKSRECLGCIEDTVLILDAEFDL